MEVLVEERSTSAVAKKNESTVEYLMENERESERLSLKVNADEWVCKYITPIIDENNVFILDVGCGSGALTNAIAKMYPNNKVIGVDASRKRLDYALNTSNKESISNVRYVNTSANRLMFEDNSFDLVLSRFLFEYLEQPLVVVEEFKRVCKPGGKIFIQDIDYQFGGIYPNDGWPKEVDIILKTMKDDGDFNYNIGRELFSLFYKAGLKKDSIKVEGYDMVAGEIKEKELMLAKWQLDALFPKVEEILKSKSKAKKVIDEIIKYLKNEETISYSLLFSIVGTKV